MPRVLITDRVAEELVDILRSGGMDVDLRPGLPYADLIGAIPDYHGLVVRSETQVTSQVIDAGKELQVVGRAGIGVDNIDVEAATRRGVVVVNAPEANTIAMAEHTIGLMLALARHIPAAHTSLRNASWERSKFIGVELRGKTLGLIGLGRTGAEVARRARGLDMNVIAVDPFIGAERFAMLGVRSVTHDEVYEQADFISLHAISSTPVLDEHEFSRLKPGVRIVNAARGNLINEDALVRAIDSGRVAGAALDVFLKEPPDFDSPVFKHDKIIVTPHLGASTTEAQERVAVDAAQQVLAVLRGEPALYAVNLPFIGLEAFKVIAPFLQAATQAGSLATQLSSGQVQGVEIEYLGELAEMDVTPLKAAVVRGLLSTRTDENVTLVNASIIAEQRGLKIVERKGNYEGIYNNLIRVHLAASDGTTTVSSTVAHDGPHIVEINDFWVDVSPGQGYLLICENQDRPGMIGRIGTFLGEKDVNISFMRVGREKVRGRALMVLGLDEEISPDLQREIGEIPDIFSVRTAKL